MAHKSPSDLLRISRLYAEAHHLGGRYGEVQFDKQSGAWFHVSQFPLPSGWSKPAVEILIDIPHGTPGYPSLAPQWFWTDRDLRTEDGRQLTHFFANVDSRYTTREYVEKNWGHFCVHVNAWHPSGILIDRGHNLLTYLQLIDAVFRDRRVIGRGAP